MTGLCFSLCLLLLLMVSTHGESIVVHNVTNLVKLESELLHNFRNYAKEMKEKLGLINRAIEDYSRIVRQAYTSPDLHAMNPIFAFRLISHMRQDWPEWQRQMAQLVGSEQIELQRRMLTLIPTHHAHKQAAQSLQSMVKFYNYAPESFLTKTKPKHLRLTPLDCYHMGREMYEKRRFREAAEWLAVPVATPHAERWGVPFGQVYEMQVKVFEKLHMRDEALQALDKALQLQPENTELRDLRLQLEQQQPDASHQAPKEVASQLEQQCRGSSVVDPQLICLLNRETSPFLLLAPLRVEDLLYDPLVILYRNSISGFDMRHLKLAYQLCPTSSKLETIAGTTICAISERYSLHTVNLMRRLQHMTGLELYMKKMFILSYNPRDPFSLQDLYKTMEVDENDIGATAMLFLNDMSMGGALTISNRQFSVFPRKGDSLIFYQGDTAFRITMCPNVEGNRLVLIRFFLDSKGARRSLSYQ